MGMFGTLLTAMVTPFTEGGSEINHQSVKSLVRHLAQTGTDSIVVGGTTGESATLSFEEKLMLFQTVIKEAKEYPNVKVIINVGSNCTQDTLHLLSKINSLEGVDGVMAVTPYYNKPSREGMYLHFESIALSTNLPVMLYNVPGRTGSSLDVQTVLSLAKISNIVALKDASGDLNHISEIIRMAPETFSVYSGDDALTLPILSLGGAGVVSVASHLNGKELKQMITYYKSGDTIGATILHQKLSPLFDRLFPPFSSNPVPVKTLLNQIGLDVGGVRLPLYPLTEEQIKQLSET